MTVIRALLLGTVLALGSCASLDRREPHYVCGLGELDLSVHYTWNPPRARLDFHDHEPPIELSLTPGTKGRRPGHYSFGEIGGVRLDVTPDALYLHRPGQPTLECGDYIVI